MWITFFLPSTSPQLPGLGLNVLEVGQGQGLPWLRNSTTATRGRPEDDRRAMAWPVWKWHSASGPEGMWCGCVSPARSLAAMGWSVDVYELCPLCLYSDSILFVGAFEHLEQGQREVDLDAVLVVIYLRSRAPVPHGTGIDDRGSPFRVCFW